MSEYYLGKGLLMPGTSVFFPLIHKCLVPPSPYLIPVLLRAIFRDQKKLLFFFLLCPAPFQGSAATLPLLPSTADTYYGTCVPAYHTYGCNRTSLLPFFLQGTVQLYLSLCPFIPSFFSFCFFSEAVFSLNLLPS